MGYNVTQLLVKPTYDISNYGEDLTLNLGAVTLALQSITLSSANFEQSGSHVVMDSFAESISDTNAVGLAHEGNNTAFDETYEFLTDMSAEIYKLDILAAFAVNVSAFTNGSVKLDSVRFTCTENLQDGTEVRTLFDKYVDCSLSALTGTGTNIFIAHLDMIPMTKVSDSKKIQLQIRINETVSGTNTRQVGILPFFPFQAAALPKPFTTPTLSMHLHPTLDHVFPILREQGVQNMLDYSGVTINNDSRGKSPLANLPQTTSSMTAGDILIG